MHEPKDRLLEGLNSLCNPHYALGHFTHLNLLCGHLFRPGEWCSFIKSESSLDRYDLASLTKALVTTPLLFRHLEKEGLGLTCTIGTWLGSSPSKFSKHILGLSIKSLLSHRSGLPDWQCFWSVCLDGSFEKLSPRERLYYRLNNLASRSLAEGSYLYSDVGFIILGMSLEEKFQRSLGCLFQDLIAEMGLKSSTLSFNDGPIQRSQSIPVGYCHVRKKDLIGEVHDENASVLNGVMGHAGLFGTAQDVAEFLATLPKTSWGKWLLDENKQSRVQGSQMIGLCGWHQGCGQSANKFAHGRSIGHLGWTGTAFWLDPDSWLFGILLTNRIKHARLSPWFNGFRAHAFELIDLYLGSSYL